jgi:hypothetical protein
MSETPDNAFEWTVTHRGPRPAAARSSFPAAQLGREALEVRRGEHDEQRTGGT